LLLQQVLVQWQELWARQLSWRWLSLNHLRWIRWFPLYSLPPPHGVHDGAAESVRDDLQGVWMDVHLHPAPLQVNPLCIPLQPLKLHWQIDFTAHYRDRRGSGCPAGSDPHWNTGLLQIRYC